MLNIYWIDLEDKMLKYINFTRAKILEIDQMILMKLAGCRNGQ
jgi:hypothetical protein